MNGQFPVLRLLAVAVGAALVALALGYAFHQTWATSTWPWPDSPLSYLFIGSVIAAMAVAFIWIGAIGEWGAVGGGAVTVLVLCGGWTAYLFTMAGGRPHLLPFALWFATVAALSGLALLWQRQFAVRDRRSMPRFLRISFGVFVGALVVAGAALLLDQPVFPWAVRRDSSVMFGWVFLGDACYFLYSLLSPKWHNARGQLLSFLAYDLLLIPPFIGLFAVIKPERLVSLSIYTAVLFYSALVAVWYLFIDPTTRGWSIREE